MPTRFKRRRRQTTDWEAIVTKGICDKGLSSNIYQELVKLNDKERPDFKNGQRIGTDTSLKKM